MGRDTVIPLLHVELAPPVAITTGVPPGLAARDAVTPSGTMEATKTRLAGLAVTSQILAPEPNAAIAQAEVPIPKSKDVATLAVS